MARRFAPERLREALDGRTIEYLSQRLGISRQAISHWLTGGGEPKGATLLALSDTLRVPPHFFYTDAS